MTKMTLGTHPYLLGFDQLERLAAPRTGSASPWPSPVSPRTTCR